MERVIPIARRDVVGIGIYGVANIVIGIMVVSIVEGGQDDDACCRDGGHNCVGRIVTGQSWLRKSQRLPSLQS